jgi:ABC-2 type transport system ATP-binding protein
MSEMAQTAERVIVVGRGRIIADTTMAAFIRSASSGRVRVRTPEPERLVEALRQDGMDVAAAGDGAMEVRGTSSEHVGAVAAASGIVLHELTPVDASLEEAFMTMTRESVEFHAGDREVAAL